MSQFYSTFLLYRNSLSNYSFPLTFDEWLNAPYEDKAALLFVNFYPQVELGWCKGRFKTGVNGLEGHVCIQEEDAIGEITQYLMKNVDIIMNKPGRFTPAYIYSVTYNCVTCMNLNKGNRSRNATTSDHIAAGPDGDSVDLFDFISYSEDPYEVQQAKEALWTIVEGMGPKALKVVNHIITGDSLSKTSKSLKNRDNDALADVSVNSSEMTQIVEDLRVALKDYAYAFGL